MFEQYQGCSQQTKVIQCKIHVVQGDICKPRLWLTEVTLRAATKALTIEMTKGARIS